MGTESIVELSVGEPVETGSAGWPDAAELMGTDIRLQSLDADLHTEGLWQAVGGLQHVALWQYMHEGPFENRDHFAKSTRAAAGQRDLKIFAIVDNRTALPVGRCAFLNIKPDQRVIEVGHLMFAPSLPRTRAATEALFLLAQYAFDDLHYRRYEWKCNALNQKSRRAAERLGFTFEGIFRQHMIVKGRNRDTAWFSMLDSEWPAIKAATETWLAPQNFDAHGTQRRTLADLMPRKF